MRSVFDNSIFGNPILAAARPTEQAPQLPPLSQEEETSLLGRIGSAGLHGLGYIGGSLSKALGGRALRGLLGGHMDELKSIIPFSDTLGITNPDREVTGAQLLGGNEDTPFLSPEGLGGFAVEALLDPATYLSFGGSALSKLGVAAKRAGVLPKSAAARLAGVAAASPEAAAIARQAGVSAAEVAGQRLGGHVGIGLPFMGNAATFDLGVPLSYAKKIPGVTKAVDVLDSVVDPFRRGANALFNANSRGFVDSSLQSAGEHAAEQLSRRAPQELQQVADFADWSRRKAGWSPGKAAEPFADQARIVGQQLNDALELMPSVGQTQVRPNAVFSLLSMDPEIVAKAKEMRSFYDNWMTKTQAAGYADVPLQDTVGFASRQASVMPSESMRSLAGGLEGMATEGQAQRTLTRGLLTREVNEIALDNTLRNMKPVDAAETIAKKYLGFDAAASAEYSALSKKAGKTLSGAEEEKLAELLAKRNKKTLTLPEATELSGIENRKAANITLAESARLKELEAVVGRSKELVSWQKSLDPKVIEKLGGYFVNHPVADMANYVNNNINRVVNAESMYGAIADMGKKALPNGDPGHSLTKAVQNIGLTGQDATANLIKAIAESHGIDNASAASLLPNLRISSDQMRSLTEFAKPATSPAGAKPFMSLFDSISNLTKAGQTSWPQTLMRNLGSDIAMRWFQGGEPLSPLVLGKTLREGGIVEGLAAKVPAFRGMTDQQATQELLKYAWTHGIANTEKFAAQEASGINPSLRVVQRELPQFGAPQRGLVETLKDTLPGRKDFSAEAWKAGESKLDPLNIRGVTVPWNTQGMPGPQTVSGFAPVAAAQATQSYLEEVNRLGTFANAMQQGLDPLAAAQRVTSAHFDYGNLSNFEKNVMRRLIPFYSYQRQALPNVIGEIASNPGGRMATTMKALVAGSGDRSGLLPESVTNTGFAIPLGDAQEGRRSYLTSLGLPFEDLANVSSLSNIIGSMSPAIRLWPELAMGRQFFTGRDIPSTFPVPGSPVMNELIAASPLSRVASTYRQLTNENRPLGETAFQMLAGPRITNIDQVQARREAIRNAAERMLVGLPQTRRFEQMSISPTNQAQLSPQELAMYQLYRAAQQTQARR